MSESHAFQYTPWGMMPIGAALPSVDSDTVSGGAVVQAAPVQVLATPGVLIKPKSDKPLTGQQITALVKARLKEVNKLLANVPALERERDSLIALLAVATPKRRKGMQ